MPPPVAFSSYFLWWFIPFIIDSLNQLNERSHSSECPSSFSWRNPPFLEGRIRNDKILFCFLPRIFFSLHWMRSQMIPLNQPNPKLFYPNFNIFHLFALIFSPVPSLKRPLRLQSSPLVYNLIYLSLKGLCDEVAKGSRSLIIRAPISGLCLSLFNHTALLLRPYRRFCQSALSSNH